MQSLTEQFFSMPKSNITRETVIEQAFQLLTFVIFFIRTRNRHRYFQNWTDIQLILLCGRYISSHKYLFELPSQHQYQSIIFSIENSKQQSRGVPIKPYFQFAMKHSDIYAVFFVITNMRWVSIQGRI